MKTTNKRVEQETINETANIIIDLFLININLHPTTELQKIILDLYFNNINHKEIFDREILKNNEKIHNIIENHYSDIPYFSVQFYIALLNKLNDSTKAEKITSPLIHELKPLSIDKSEDSSLRMLFYKILIRLAHHNVYVSTHEKGVYIEDFNDYLYELQYRLEYINNKYNKVYYKNNIRILDFRDTSKAFDDDDFFGNLKQLFTAIFLNSFYSSNKNNPEVLNTFFGNLHESGNVNIFSFGHKENKSFKWTSTKTSIRNLYDGLKSIDFIKDDSTFDSFNNCFNESTIKKKYEFKETKVSQIIYLIHLLEQSDLISKSTNFQVTKFTNTFNVGSKKTQISPLLSRIKSDDYNNFPFTRERKKQIDKMIENLNSV